MNDLTSITTPARTGDRSFVAQIPDGWQQGRGAFGGLVIANLVRAIEAFDGEPERSLRSLTAEICGPVQPGPNAIHVERFRTGTGVATIGARLVRDGEVLAHAVGVMGKRRLETHDFCDLVPPEIPPWQEVPAIPVQPPFGPVFAQHVEFRVLGPPPYSGAAEPVASGFARFKDPGAARDSAYIAALADIWWPSFFARESTPRPAATIAFTLEILGGLAGLDPEAPLFHRARTIAGNGGYVVELRELWGLDGRLVALNQQTLTIIK
jgi:hypothetical protein